MVCNASYSFNLFNLDVRECGQMSYKLCQGEKKTSGILEVRFIRILVDVLEHASNTSKCSRKSCHQNIVFEQTRNQMFI